MCLQLVSAAPHVAKPVDLNRLHSGFWATTGGETRAGQWGDLLRPVQSPPSATLTLCY